MKKLINYLIQSIIIYLFFFIGLVIGLNLSRKLYASLFNFLGPILKSKKIIDKNLNIFSRHLDNVNKKKNYKKYVEELWNDFYRVYLFKTNS